MEPVTDVETNGGPGAAIRLKVVPGGSRDAVAGRHGDRVRVKVSAPPEGGKANEAVVRLLAKALGVGRRAIEITQGHASPQKTAVVAGLDARTVGCLLYGEER